MSKLLTLLDITKRNGTDQAVGLVEAVTTFAPEIDVVMGRPIPGTTYKTRIRQALPAGPAFRNANEGSPLVASSYAQTISQCYILDAQMQVDKAVAEAPEEGGAAELLADEAEGAMRQKSIELGSQFYYGTSADAKGFAGLQSLVDSTMVVDAQGTGNNTTSVYLVYNDVQGVHFIFGNNTGLQMGEWTVQQVVDPNNSANRYFAYVNCMTGWIGLSANNPSKTIVRIKNITSAKPLTDALLAQAYAKFPIGLKPNRIFLNRDANYYIQNSRSAVTQQAFKLGAAADYPTNSPSVPGVAFTITDSITTAEVAA